MYLLFFKRKCPKGSEDVQPPTSTTLTTRKIDQNTVGLSWQNMNVADFDRYEIYRSTDSLSVFSNLIASIYEQDSIESYDNNVDSGIIYYYGVRTVDDGELFGSSDISRIYLIYSYALDFNGVDDYAFIPFIADVVDDPSFTIELWIYWKNNTKTEIIFARDIVYIQLYLLSGGDLGFNLTPTCGGGQIQNSVQDYQWVHLAFTYDHVADTVAIYKKGNLERAVFCDVFQPEEKDLYIGARTVLTAPFTGTIDEIRIWDYARSQTEIQNNYDKVITSDSGLVGYYGFYEGSGQTFDGIGPTGRLGSTASEDANDPVWVPFDAPIEY